jgi:hypothetical protein
MQHGFQTAKHRSINCKHQQFVVELASAMDRTGLPAKGRCQGSALSTLDVRQANSALGVLTICARFGSTVLIVKPSIKKNVFRSASWPSRTRAIERSVESCTRCAEAEQLLDGFCSRLNKRMELAERDICRSRAASQIKEQ